jgi:hypothetical protein
MRKNKIKLIITTAICTALLVTGLTIGTLMKNNEADAQEHVDPTSIFTSNALLTKNRDKIIICVDNVSSTKDAETTNDVIIKKVEKQIEKFSKESRWKDAGYPGLTVQVKEGCSFTPLLNNETAHHPINSGNLDSTRMVTTPSPETLGIFIVDQKIIDKHFKDAPNRWSPEQLACENEVCNEVTKGIYLTNDEVKEISSLKMYKELIIGLGLQSISDIPINPNQAQDELNKEKERKSINK